MGLEVFLLEETHVVRRDQRRTAALGERDCSVQILFVIDSAGALNFQVEAVGKHIAPFSQTRFGQWFVAIEQRLADLSLPGARQGDHTFGGLLDPVALDDHQIVALAFGPAARDQLGEIAIPLGIHRQQGQAAERTVLVTTSHPDIGTANRLYAGALRGFIELDQRAHIAHVGHRHCRHATCRDRLDQRLDPNQPIDQRVLGMQT